MTTTDTLLATMHFYEVGVTAELTDEQTARLSGFLEDLARESGGKYNGAAVFGKTGQAELQDFNPLRLRMALAAAGPEPAPAE